MKRQPWTNTDLALLADLFPHAHSEDVAALMGRSLSSIRNAAHLNGLRKTAEYLKSEACGRLHGESFNANRFKPGHKTWNAGMKGWSPVGTQATQFKPGSKPVTTRPIGAERLDADGYLLRKVSQTGVRKDDWRSVHALVWEQEVGPIAKGSVVVFKAGKKTTVAADIKPEVLECLTRADLMRRNSYHRYPPELARMYQLRGALNRQINKHTKALNEPHQHSTSASA